MEINYSEKYSLILKFNRMYQTSYMNKTISKLNIQKKNIRINIRIDNKPCMGIAENENEKGR